MNVSSIEGNLLQVFGGIAQGFQGGGGEGDGSIWKYEVITNGEFEWGGGGSGGGWILLDSWGGMSV